MFIHGRSLIIDCVKVYNYEFLDVHTYIRSYSLRTESTNATRKANQKLLSLGGTELTGGDSEVNYINSPNCKRRRGNAPYP